MGGIAKRSWVAVWPAGNGRGELICSIVVRQNRPILDHHHRVSHHAILAL
jgi:hypothetical protein